MQKFLAFVAAGLLLAACSNDHYVFQHAPPNEPEASIAFVQYNNVTDWHPVSDTLLYVEGLDRQWYQVNLFYPCVGLGFADRVAFLPSDPQGDFDRFSSIAMGHQVCKVASVKKVPPPTRAPRGAPPAGPTAAPASAGR